MKAIESDIPKLAPYIREASTDEQVTEVLESIEEFAITAVHSGRVKGFGDIIMFIREQVEAGISPGEKAALNRVVQFIKRDLGQA